MTVLHTDASGAELSVVGRLLTVVQRGETRDVTVSVLLPEDAEKRTQLAAALLPDGAEVVAADA